MKFHFCFLWFLCEMSKDCASPFWTHEPGWIGWVEGTPAWRKEEIKGWAPLLYADARSNTIQTGGTRPQFDIRPGGLEGRLDPPPTICGAEEPSVPLSSRYQKERKFLYWGVGKNSLRSAGMGQVGRKWQAGVRCLCGSGATASSKQALKKAHSAPMSAERLCTQNWERSCKKNL